MHQDSLLLIWVFACERTFNGTFDDINGILSQEMSQIVAGVPCDTPFGDVAEVYYFWRLPSDPPNYTPHCKTTPGLGAWGALAPTSTFPT
jgi:hypothetical protein